MPRPAALDSINVASFSPDETFARHMDSIDPLAPLRDRFHVPRTRDGRDAVYLCGNSLGLMPKAARAIVGQELDDWANLAVEAHFQGATPWYSYHEVFRESGARLVGALPGEVVMMNSLTVNLHLMMASFLRPAGGRRKVLIEEGAFPSDTYAVKSHMAARDLDPVTDLVLLAPRRGACAAPRRSSRPSPRATRWRRRPARRRQLPNRPTARTSSASPPRRASGPSPGWDLAAAEYPLRLHDWNADFACWCSYKYLNAGPGAHRGLLRARALRPQPRSPAARGLVGQRPRHPFRMHLEPEFVPRVGARRVAVRATRRSWRWRCASLDLFDEVVAPGRPAARAACSPEGISVSCCTNGCLATAA
ncbi:MAG: hypothetical protein U0575_00415 [Phycisphaerales bacterium]